MYIQYTIFNLTVNRIGVLSVNAKSAIISLNVLQGKLIIHRKILFIILVNINAYQCSRNDKEIVCTIHKRLITHICRRF